MWERVNGVGRYKTEKDKGAYMEIKLAEESVGILACKIADKLLQGIEDLLIRADSGLFGLILQHHLAEIQKKQEKEQREAELMERVHRLSNIPAYGTPKISSESGIDVAAENQRWEQEKKA